MQVSVIVNALSLVGFVFQISKDKWKTQVDPRMKVAWYAEDLNNDTKVRYGFKLKHYTRTIKEEITPHHLRVFYELTTSPASSWLDSSVGRSQHRYRTGHVFESRSSLNIFQALISQLLRLCI